MNFKLLKTLALCLGLMLSACAGKEEDKKSDSQKHQEKLDQLQQESQDCLAQIDAGNLPQAYLEDFFDGKPGIWRLVESSIYGRFLINGNIAFVAGKTSLSLSANPRSGAVYPQQRVVCGNVVQAPDYRLRLNNESIFFIDRASGKPSALNPYRLNTTYLLFGENFLDETSKTRASFDIEKIHNLDESVFDKPSNGLKVSIHKINERSFALRAEGVRKETRLIFVQKYILEP